MSKYRSNSALISSIATLAATLAKNSDGRMRVPFENVTNHAELADIEDVLKKYAKRFDAHPEVQAARARGDVMKVEYRYHNFIKLIEFADSYGFGSDALADRMVAEASGRQQDAINSSDKMIAAAIGFLEARGFEVTGYKA